MRLIRAGSIKRKTAIALAAVLATVGLVFAPASPAYADPACQTGGVYVLWVRGSGQPIYDVEAQRFQGHVNSALNAVGLTTHQWAELGNLDGDVPAGQFPNEPAEYPATSVTDWRTLPSGYGTSVDKGTDELVAHLNDRYAGDGPTGSGPCASETVVIGGYSQGADVIGWALERTGYGSISQTARNNIGFVALYGDPKSNRRDCNLALPWRRATAPCGNGHDNGILPPRNPYLPSDFVDRTGSWCEVGDFVCSYYYSTPLFGNHLTTYRGSPTQPDGLIWQSAAEIAAEARAKKCQLNPATCLNVAAHSDMNGDSRADLFLMTNEPTGSKGFALPSKYASFTLPQQWWNGAGYSWSGVTPLVGDVTGSEHRADLIFLTNEGANGTKVYVATSTGAGFNAPQLWYNATGFGYTGLKPLLGDVDNNGCEDLVVVTNEGAYGSKGYVLLSTCLGFLAPQLWWNGAGFGWSGITPLVGDVMNGDKKADLVYLTNEGASGTKAFVATSTGSLASGGFGTGQLKWTGTGMMYAGIKPALGDVDGNGCTDLVVVTNEGINGTKAFVLLSTCGAFLSHAQWGSNALDWSGVTPFVGDVTGDKKADYVVLHDALSGILAYEYTSSGSGFSSAQTWWSGTDMAYSGIKAYLK